MPVPTAITDLSTVAADNFPKGNEFVGNNPDNYIRAHASFIAYLRDELTDVGRNKLSGDAIYYVRTDGSDSNTGLANTSGGAFLTIQRAIDVVLRTLDLNGHNVVINVADGAYTAGVNVAAPWVGDGTVYLTGNETTPGNVTITVAGGDCISADNGGQIFATGFRLSTTGSGANIRAYTGARVTAKTIEHGACAASHHECGTGGVIGIYGSPKILGGGVSHLHCGAFGMIFCDTTVDTAIPSAVAFSAYFAGAAEGGTIVVPGMTFSGAGVAGVTGQRYVVHKNAFIHAAAIANALPGDSAGRTATGGVYKASVTDPLQISPDTGTNDSVVLYSRDSGTGAYTPRVVVNNTPTGYGYFYMNGDGCYSTGRTYFGNTNLVQVSSGTEDGFSLESKANLALGFSPFATSANGAACGYMRRRSSDGTILGFFRDTTSVGSISVTTTATAYNTSSDYRLKESVVDLQGSGEFIDMLRPRRWSWKADGSKGAGFVAHELQEVSPSSVTGEKDGEEMQSVCYSSPEMIANLVAEVQDLRKRVAALEK